MKNEVCIVIPVYKSLLEEYEKASLEQCSKVLNDFQIVFVKPESLGLTLYKTLIKTDNFSVEVFDDAFFKDIQGYNRLMLSEAFYQRFSAYEYILVYQLDAFVFKNELAYWCQQGYDYIGAPWIRPYWLRKQIRSLIHYKWNLKSDGIHPTLHQFYNRVGNGGFSLRRVAQFYELCKNEKKMIAFYNARESHFFNEDVFWSLEVNRREKRLKIPDYHTAIHFSIEQWPELGFELTKGALPFGAHGLHAAPDFWRPRLCTAGYHLF